MKVRNVSTTGSQIATCSFHWELSRPNGLNRLYSGSNPRWQTRNPHGETPERSVWPSRQFTGVSRSSLKSTVSSLWMPVSGWRVIRELRDSLPTSLWYAIPKRLLRNHPNRPQPRLHQLRPCRHRKLRSPQSERVPSLSIQMLLHGNASVLQRNVVSKRVVCVVHVVILVLQQERRWRLGGLWNFGIQRKMLIGRRRMRNHELFGALLSVPFRRGK